MGRAGGDVSEVGHGTEKKTVRRHGTRGLVTYGSWL